MIPQFPFFRPPFYYPYRYYNYQNFSNQNIKNNAHKTVSNNEYTNSNTETSQNKRSLSQESSDETLEIFGIKLHFDDILLICLIFFLYKQNVNDPLLFIALILLLLS